MDRKRLAVAVLLFLAPAAAVQAQDTPRVGLTMAYPSSIGLIWHVSPRLAIRPDLSFGWSSSEPPASTIGGGSSDATNLSVGIAGLIYVGKWDALRAYVAPHFGYGRTSTTTVSTITIGIGPGASINTSTMTTKGTASISEVAGSFGAEYTLGRRFAVFAETGLAFVHAPGISISTGSVTGATFASTRNSGTTRGGVGAIVYF